MNLIINQVMEFQVVHVPNRNRAVKLFAGTSVTQTYFTGTVDWNAFPLFTVIHMLFQIIIHFFRNTVLPDFCKLFPGFICVVIGQFQCLHDILFVGTVKYRRLNLKAEGFRRKTKMDFQNLSDIHTGRYTQRVQHDIQWSAIWQERHILHRQNT